MAIGRKRKKAADDEATGAARDEQAVAVEEAAAAGLADDAPEAVTTGTESVVKATEPETVGEREIDARFDGQDIGQEEQLAAMIGQTQGEDDPLAAQFGNIDTALGTAGRDRLAELTADLVPDDTEDGPTYTQDMLAAEKGGGSSASGHPGAYGVVADEDGEVTGWWTADPKLNLDTIFGVEVGNIRYDQEMTKKADEAAQNRNAGGSGGTGSGTGGSGGTGSGSGGTGGTGSGTGGSGGSGGTGSGTGGSGGSGSGATTTNNPDGSITSTYPDGTSITTQPDGSQAVIHPDGSMDIYDKDGNLVEHQDPPPPPDDGEGDDGEGEGEGEKGSVKSQPDEDYVDPETERLLREELAKDPGYAHYQKQRGADGAIDPADDGGAPTTPVGEPTGELLSARDRYGMGGDPVDPEVDSTSTAPSDAGYYNDPNHGAIDYEDAVHDGPTRNDDPFAGVGNTPKPPASSEADDSDEPVDSFLPPSAVAGRVDDGPDVPDAVLDETAP